MKKEKGSKIKEIILNNIIVLILLILSAFVLSNLIKPAGGLNLFEGIGQGFLISYLVIILLCIYLYIRQSKIEILSKKIIYVFASLALVFLLIIIISLSQGISAFIWMISFIVPLPILIILIDYLVKKIIKK